MAISKLLGKVGLQPAGAEAEGATWDVTPWAAAKVAVPKRANVKNSFIMSLGE
jgi:hypothetical protein